MGQVPDPDKLCSDGLPNSSDCTAQTTWENLPNIPKVFICMWSLEASLIGHINWVPVTYSGGLLWQEKTTDQDCNFGTKTAENRGLTRGSITAESGLLGLEFDSRETIRRMHTAPWAEIWTKLDTGASNVEINALLQKETGNDRLPFAVLIGLFGVDCEHDCHSELHPVYAIALQLNSSASDNVWGIFVRNWGNEGFCAHGQANLTLPNNEIKLLLPHIGTTKPNVGDKTQFYTTDQLIQPPSISYISNASSAGVLVDFKLPDPSKKALAEFELHLIWPDGSEGPSGGARDSAAENARPTATKPQKVEDFLENLNKTKELRAEESLSFLAEQLPTTSRREIPKPYPINQTSLEEMSAAPDLGSGLVHLVFDPAEQQQSEVFFQKICSAYKNQPPQLPAGACEFWRKRQTETNQAKGPSRDRKPK